MLDIRGAYGECLCLSVPLQGDVVLRDFQVQGSNPCDPSRPRIHFENLQTARTPGPFIRIGSGQGLVPAKDDDPRPIVDPQKPDCEQQKVGSV